LGPEITSTAHSSELINDTNPAFGECHFGIYRHSLFSIITPQRQIMQRVIICVANILDPYPSKYSGYYRHQMLQHSKALIYSYVVSSIYIKIKHRKYITAGRLKSYSCAFPQLRNKIRPFVKEKNVKRLIAFPGECGMLQNNVP